MLIIISLISILMITVSAQSLSVFSMATKSGWYPEFLSPVVDSILNNPVPPRILDIGTGYGTLLNQLVNRGSQSQMVGIDIDSGMIDEARIRFPHAQITFQYQKIGAPLDFADQEFDIVTFCSVLFLVDDNIKDQLINEALRVLSPNGRIIILTPSGTKPVLSSFLEVWKYPFSLYNFTFPVWKIATTNRARYWMGQKWVEEYSRAHQLKYKNTLTFQDNAIVEIIYKEKSF